nr:hypothetical protein [Pseudomonas sp. BIGb0427]
MSEDYAVWDIDQILEAYSQEPELRDGVEAGLTALLVFLEKHQLLTCRVTDAQGKLFKRALMASEISGRASCLPMAATIRCSAGWAPKAGKRIRRT